MATARGRSGNCSKMARSAILNGNQIENNQRSKAKCLAESPAQGIFNTLSVKQPLARAKVRQELPRS
jgi:hypothetical protein